MNVTDTDARTRVAVRPGRFRAALKGLSVRDLAAEVARVNPGHRIPPSSVGLLVAYANGLRKPERRGDGQTTLGKARLVAAALGVEVGSVFSHPNGDPLEGEQ